MQRKDRAPRPRAVLPRHIQILAETQKLQYTAPYKRECTNPFFTAAMLESGIKGIHVTKKKAAMHFASLERRLSR